MNQHQDGVKMGLAVKKQLPPDVLAFFKEQGAKGVMIGRAAVYNPAIFNLLKDKPAPSLEQLRKEYLELADQFNAPFKYQKNVLKRLGRPIETIKQMQSESVQG